MVAGRVTPPTVVLSNEKIIRRHLHSVVMAAFFRWAKNQKGTTYKDVGQSFVPNDREPGPSLLADYLNQHPTVLNHALNRVMPLDTDLRRELALANWEWVSQLMNSEAKGILTWLRQKSTVR